MAVSSDTGLTPKQIQSIADADGLVNLWEGAVSSGKTVASIFRWLQFIGATRCDRSRAPLPGELVLTGRTRDSAWRNILLPMMDLYPGVVKGNLGAPYASVLGERVHVIGASDAKAESVIRGMTCLGIYVDEVTTIPEPYFKMALSRLRVTGRSGGIASKLFGATNPDNPLHWLRRDYILRMRTDETMRRDWRVFHFDLDDNPRLSPRYVESMKAQYTGLFYDRFILGKWVQGEGLVLSGWDESRLVVDPLDIPPMERTIGVGVDYGSTNPSAAVIIGYAQGKLWVLDEWHPHRGRAAHEGSMSPAKQSLSFRQWLARQPDTPEGIWVDPAAAHFREQLYGDGVNTAPAWNSVLKGIEQVHSLISLDRLRVSSTCVQLREEVPGYVWDPKASERGEDSPLKVNDHAVDALRYAIASSSPIWRPMMPLASEIP